MNTAHGNATPANGLWGVLKQIVTVNGFFGPGFWQDFKEGWQEEAQRQQAAQAAARAAYVPEDDEDVGEVESTLLHVADPYKTGLIWDDDNPMLNVNCL